MNHNPETLTLAVLTAALADIDAADCDLQALYDAADAADLEREDVGDGDGGPCAKVHRYGFNSGDLTLPSMGTYFFFETNDARDAFVKEVNANAKFSLENGASLLEIAFIVE